MIHEVVTLHRYFRLFTWLRKMANNKLNLMREICIVSWQLRHHVKISIGRLAREKDQSWDLG